MLGRKYQVTGTVGNASPLFEIGEEVALLYPERAPEQARIDALSETGFPIAFGLGFFVLFGGLGTTFVLMARRRRATTQPPDANR